MCLDDSKKLIFSIEARSDDARSVDEDGWSGSFFDAACQVEGRLGCSDRGMDLDLDVDCPAVCGEDEAGGTTVVEVDGPALC